MPIKHTSRILLLIILLTSTLDSYAQKIKPEDIIVKHLDSLGATETRLSVKNQIIVGEATVKFLTQKSPPVQGRIVLASAGEKNFLGMSFNSIDYPAEKFSFDGREVNVGYVKLGTRSVLGNFIASNKKLLNESLMGGVLNSSWALLDITNKKAKLSFNGIKKISGKEAYVLSYLTKSGGDVEVNLYFDKETFHHIRTEYKRTSSARIGLRPEDSSKFNETQFRIVEDFSNFKSEQGITFPHGYHILYSVIGGSNGTTEIEWTFNLTEFAFNQKLADGTFNAAAN